MNNSVKIKDNFHTPDLRAAKGRLMGASVKMKRFFSKIMVIMLGIGLLKVSYGYWTENLTVSGEATLKFQVEIADNKLHMLDLNKTKENTLNTGEDEILSEEDGSSTEEHSHALPVVIPKFNFETQTIENKDAEDKSETKAEIKSKIKSEMQDNSMILSETEDKSVASPVENNKIESSDDTRGEDTVDK
jgi:hypothetical protein